MADEIEFDEWDDGVGEGIDAAMAVRAERWSLDGVDLPWDADDRPDWESALDDSDPEPDVVGDEAKAATHFERCDVNDALPDRTRHWCCLHCRAAPRLPGHWSLCASCQVEILRRVCGMRPKLAKGRCDTCRKYFDRRRVERPRELITRSGERPLTLAELDLAVRRNREADSDPFR